MGQALYRKYRSKSFDEIVGQDHITATLKNALKKGRLSHAYLLTGPRGVGKTSVARILAHEVNDLPYNSEANHLDIIEIDAASNRRIDEIRELRERVQVAPALAKYKVYIIDEVHMLTKEAFNALLKTLEEPPAHVIFILATTEAYKLPETIISRTQRFSFKPIEQSELVSHLETIARKEEIDITKEALEIIAAHSEGSFRDSIGMLDQAQSISRHINREDVLSMLGLAPESALEELMVVLQNGTARMLVDLLNRLYEQGYQPKQLAKQLCAHVRKQLIDGSATLPTDYLMKLMQQLLEISVSFDPQTSLELTLLNRILQNDEARVKVPKKLEAVLDPLPTNVKKLNLTSAKLDDQLWQQALQTIKKKHNTLYGIARMAQAEFSDQKLILRFGFAFHHKHINQQQNRQIIIDTISELSGQTITLECLIDQTQKRAASLPKPEIKPSSNESMSTISNIFGGAEVLE